MTVTPIAMATTTAQTRSRWIKRVEKLFAAVTLIAVMVTMSPNTVWADPAEPTDYESKIIRIEPDFADIEMQMIGGDSFIQLDNRGRHNITVIGYRAEPFLRFDQDGSVWENLRAPSRWLSADRYADTVVPATADSLAPPKWAQVADDGIYTWHDHRTHWMNKAKPPVAEPGDQILELVVPLRIDGTLVDISVASYILAPPSKLPAALGVIVGATLAILAIRRHSLLPSILITTSAIAALTVGTIAFRSVPRITEPQVSLWAIPTLALLLAVVTVAISNRMTTTVFIDGFRAAGAALLAYWSITRASALYRSLIPTDVNFALDRFVITSTFAIGVIVALKSLHALTSPKRLS